MGDKRPNEPRVQPVKSKGVSASTRDTTSMMVQARATK